MKGVGGSLRMDSPPRAVVRERERSGDGSSVCRLSVTHADGGSFTGEGVLISHDNQDLVVSFVRGRRPVEGGFAGAGIDRCDLTRAGRHPTENLGFGDVISRIPADAKYGLALWRGHERWVHQANSGAGVETV